MHFDHGQYACFVPRMGPGIYRPAKIQGQRAGAGDLANYVGLPSILAPRVENGPRLPELKAPFPDAPCLARPGNINGRAGRLFSQGMSKMHGYYDNNSVVAGERIGLNGYANKMRKD